ncbi:MULTISPECIES: DUF262 domain-containing protein [Paraburkholderia]|uniref:DUF262 domain-containing protein n=1 Tax=Paraburkholderia TaxID=1822464 RepID=UPI0006B3F276|nr:hypothetical protein AC233_10745 [Burkholderia sp. HB1]OWJ56165.1 DUF262 domain-containing protein [Burkholderia sp. Bk]
MEPSKQPLSKLLTIEGTHESYRIPKYQRPYSWSTHDWEQLLEDIDEDASQADGHFMGSVICVDKSSGAPGEPRVFELIDGQQRITTLSCLLISVWAALNKRYLEATGNVDGDLDEDDIKDLQAIMDDVRRKVVRERRYQREEPLPPLPLPHSVANDFYIGRRNRTDFYCRLLPSTQDLNREDFVFALSHYGLLPGMDIAQPRNWGNRRLAKCLRFIADALPSEVASLKILSQRINALIFIHIKVDSQSDAFRLFEAINNRGVPLSALDIIKNAMLAALERDEEGSIDEAFETWSTMTERLGSDTGLHESYLRHFYNAFQVEPGRRVPRANRATKSTLIHIFEQLIRSDAKRLLDDLASRAVFYGSITQPEDADLPDARRAALVNLARVEARPSYQFLLYLLDRETRGRCKAGDVNRIIDLLSRYFVRRNLTNVPATNRLDAIFIDLVAKCDAVLADKDSTITYDFVRNALMSLPRGDAPATDDEMMDALAEHLYWYNPTMARYLLCRFVENRVTKEQYVDLWRRDDKGRYVWTIEHVLPQGKPLKAGWVRMLADGDQETPDQIQEDHVHLLGNLTLSAYNSTLSDAILSAKQKKTTVTLAGIRANIGFQNGMLLNDLTYKVDRQALSLATTEVWNEHHILARGEVLIAAMMKDYRL